MGVNVLLISVRLIARSQLVVFFMGRDGGCVENLLFLSRGKSFQSQISHKNIYIYISLLQQQMIQMNNRVNEQNDQTSTDKRQAVLERIGQKYEIRNIVLDQNAIQKLYVAWNQVSKQVMTVKITNKSSILNDKRLNAYKHLFRDIHIYAIKNEIFLFKNFKHQNIAKINGYSQNERHLYIFLQYCPRGSIHSIINKNGPFSFQQVMPLWRQLLGVILYLHRNGIVYRDLNPRNIYINEKGKLKLMNLKQAYQMQECSTMQETIIHKTNFMAPEIFAGQQVTPKMDVWSLGVTLFFMLYGCSPWPHARQNDWHRRLGSNIVFPDNSEDSTKLTKAIEKMLVYDAFTRVSMKELAQQFAV